MEFEEFEEIIAEEFKRIRIRGRRYINEYIREIYVVANRDGLTPQDVRNYAAVFSKGDKFGRGQKAREIDEQRPYERP